MALQRRTKEGPYWVDITIPGGQRIRRSTGTKDRKEAQEYHDALRASSWRVCKLKEKPDYVWQDAVKQWMKEKKGKSSLSKDQMIFRGMRKYLDGVRLKDITREGLAFIAEEKAKESSEATANRHMDLVRAVLRKAADEWEWIDKAPKVHMYSIDSKRIHWITHTEADRLCKCCPEHLEPMVRFSLATGLRHNNVCRLRWSQVDLVNKRAWIHPDEAKTRKAIAVPLNTDAVEVIRSQLGKHDEFVFTYKGDPILRSNTTAWKKALKEAKIADFRWHDLRHTWASWHVQSGTDIHVLQEMGGWKSIEMVQRYAHLSSKHLVDHAERIVTHDTSASQSRIAGVS